MGNKLFIYGTLMNPEIQQEIWGRVVEGLPDTLKGYKKLETEINGEKYPMIVPDDRGEVEGLLVNITNDELKKADEYETDAYKRIRVTLESGTVAWVYVKR